eukprot:CAMPEP_0184299008 /NCGR_PEP_ID=MMETSP1049-20130417/9710_1 /TAXON_ID=77928 /ORGANISM="Proteomonas sulcata, Strain CCMP704" /LENGTH=100 /DNA_ID=CAMNT_0026609319 /DNA_START=102 /DNA_END=404 /DNA_ORIENTATION=+
MELGREGIGRAYRGSMDIQRGSGSIEMGRSQSVSQDRGSMESNGQTDKQTGRFSLEMTGGTAQRYRVAQAASPAPVPSEPDLGPSEKPDKLGVVIDNEDD